MKAALLIAGSGPLVILTSHTSFTNPVLIKKLREKRIEKFIAYELPLAVVQERYGGHFQHVMQDLHESDDLRVLDEDGERAFHLFRFKELAEPVMFEPEPDEGSRATMPADDVR